MQSPVSIMPMRELTKLGPIATNIPSAEDASSPEVQQTSGADSKAMKVENLVADGGGQPLPSVNNVAIRMFRSSQSEPLFCGNNNALSKLAGLKTGSKWGKMKLAVSSVSQVKRAADLEVPNYDAGRRKSTFAASFGTAKRNLGDYNRTEAPAVHSYLEPTSTLKTNGIVWAKPHQPRVRPPQPARKQSVFELRELARPAGVCGAAVPSDVGFSLSAPASLRASPLATRRASASCSLLPELSSAGNVTPPMSRRFRAS